MIARQRGVAVLAGMVLAIVAAGSVIGEDKPAVPLIPLQPLIDNAEDGAVLMLEPGTYAGPVSIEKPLTIDGGGKAVVDGGGKGTVISVYANGATIRNLRITNSGESHNDIDAAVRLEGDYNVVKDNVIDECLFGVDIQQADNNIVRRNSISSKSDASLGVKGDAIRLWYSKNNKVEDNTVFGSRDMVIWYSSDNRIANNHVRDGRYGLHFMYSKYNLVEGNSFDRNSVGIFLMYSDDVVVRNNRLFQALGPTGIGVGLKETSNVEITDNEILYNASGIYLDMSPFQPDTTNRIYRNTIAFNGVGVGFLTDWPGNKLLDNVFINNIQQVAVGEFAGATRNTWKANYWDDFEGFDQDRNGVGDKAHTMMVYADRVWMDVPPAAFFRGTPLLSALDFFERLAPFTSPIVMLEDEKPRMTRTFEAETASEKPSEAGATRLDPFGLGRN